MHRKPEKDDAGTKVPRVCMDYLFMTEKDRKDGSNPMLVMEDEMTKEKYARAVGQKGLGTEGEMDWLIRDMSDELKSWGHGGGDAGHIILKLKSDGEPAIVAVREALARYHGGKVVPECPPRGESQTHGGRAEQIPHQGLLHAAYQSLQPAHKVNLLPGYKGTPHRHSLQSVQTNPNKTDAYLLPETPTMLFQTLR